jgi:hypothetical protein
LEHFSVHDIELGLRLLSAGVAGTADVFKDCGAPELVDDLNKIAMLLEGGPWKWVLLLATEIANILSHDSLGANVRAAVKAWEKKDFHTSGYVRAYYVLRSALTCINRYHTGLVLAVLIKDNPKNAYELKKL